jgi:arylsulfatase A-like enzyme
MAYFFTDYSRALLGLRDGRWKAIHDMTSGRTRLFDVAADPGESVDLAPREPERTENYRRRLLAACAEQRAFVHDRAAPRS